MYRVPAICLVALLQLLVYDLQQCISLVLEQAESRVFPEVDVPVLINNHVHPACNGEKPVFGIVQFHNFTFNIGKQCKIIEVLIGDELPVRFL